MGPSWRPIGDTEVLVTAAASRSVREGQDFFPLTVDVEERMYSVGRIPGSFFRREGRATEQATLTARLIDRPLRPSFADSLPLRDPRGGHDHGRRPGQNPYDVLALNAASAALTVSAIPFLGPIGRGPARRCMNGEWIAFPTFEEMDESVFEIVVAGKRNDAGGVDIAMVEAGATENGYRLVQDGAPASDEETVARGLEEAKDHIGSIIDLQLELRRQLGEPDAGGVAGGRGLLGRACTSRSAAVARPRLEAMGTISDKTRAPGHREADRRGGDGRARPPRGRPGHRPPPPRRAFRSIQEERDAASRVRARRRPARRPGPHRHPAARTSRWACFPSVHGSGAVPAGRDPGAQRRPRSA